MDLSKVYSSMRISENKYSNCFFEALRIVLARNGFSELHRIPKKFGGHNIAHYYALSDDPHGTEEYVHVREFISSNGVPKFPFLFKGYVRESNKGFIEHQINRGIARWLKKYEKKLNIRIWQCKLAEKADADSEGWAAPSYAQPSYSRALWENRIICVMKSPEIGIYQKGLTFTRAGTIINPTGDKVVCWRYATDCEDDLLFYRW